MVQLKISPPMLQTQHFQDCRAGLIVVDRQAGRTVVVPGAAAGEVSTLPANVPLRGADKIDDTHRLANAFFRVDIQAGGQGEFLPWHSLRGCA
jgi:hypothetical protein